MLPLSLASGFCNLSLLVIHRDTRVHNAFAMTEDGTVNEFSPSWPLFERIDQAVFDNLFSLAVPDWTSSIEARNSTTGVVGVVVDPITMRNFAEEPSFGRWPWSRAAWKKFSHLSQKESPRQLFSI